MVAPRHVRGFSFGSKSSKSHHSNSSGNNDPAVSIEETAEEKARRHLHSKADPTIAMSELQPMAVAFEKSSLGNIREMPHKDQYGNVITDPDLSNPTRPRLERPLDTIRSFENAVNDTFTSRNSGILKSPVDSTPGDFSRRGSYFGANDQPRHGPSRRQSYNDGYQAAEYYPYNNNQNQRTSRSRPRISRRTTDQSANGQYASGQYGQYTNGQNGQFANQYANGSGQYTNGYDRYPPAQQSSFDNITAGSGQTEPYGNSTDPSSVNSSIDRLQQQQQQQQQMKQQRMQENGQARTSQPKHVFGAPVADPNSGGPVGGPVGGAAPQSTRRHLRKSNLSEVSTGENKRKSWFKRTFSKS